MILVELCTSNSFLWFSLNEFKKDAHIQLGPKRWSKMLINGILIYYFSFKWIIKIRTIIRISIMYFWIWRTEPKILKISFLLFFNSKILSHSIIILLYLNSNVFFPLHEKTFEEHENVSCRIDKSTIFWHNQCTIVILLGHK